MNIETVVTKFIQNFRKAIYSCGNPQTYTLNDSISGQNTYSWIKGKKRANGKKKKKTSLFKIHFFFELACSLFPLEKEIKQRGRKKSGKEVKENRESNLSQICVYSSQ